LKTTKQSKAKEVFDEVAGRSLYVLAGGLEKSGLENVGPNRRGGKGGTGKRGNIMCMGSEM